MTKYLHPSIFVVSGSSDEKIFNPSWYSRKKESDNSAVMYPYSHCHTFTSRHAMRSEMQFIRTWGNEYVIGIIMLICKNWEAQGYSFVLFWLMFRKVREELWQSFTILNGNLNFDFRKWLWVFLFVLCIPSLDSNYRYVIFLHPYIFLISWIPENCKKRENYYISSTCTCYGK